MRRLLAAFVIAAGAALISNQSASAAPAAATAIKATSLAQLAQYREGYTRHGFVKCYRFLVIGHYRCHYYRDF
jgi:hypothetical protein